MKSYIRRCRAMIMISLVLLTAGFLLYEVRMDARGAYEDTGASVFSLSDYFYEESVTVRVDIEGAARIYYSLDGSTPDENSFLYEGGIELTASEAGIEAYTVKVTGYDAGGGAVGTYTHTYFIGEDAGTRFTTLVFSITGDPEGLYGDESGILVGGTLKESYMEAHPDEAEASAPANYYLRGSESEREVWLEVIDSDGELLLSQGAGLRVHGGVTRSYDLKSLRLLADDEYGADSFELDLFGTGTGSYGSFVLRNSGNDYMHAFMRSETALSLAADAGLDDTALFAPAAVFINGEYYGFEWITETYDDAYFHNKYGTSGDEGSWQLVETDDGLIETEAGDDLYEVQAVNDWNEIYTLCTTQDLTDDDVFYEFASKVDVENFLLYSAVEIYLANSDWPNNNCKVYRWYSVSNEYGDGSTDGKWRFLIYDIDESLGKQDASSASDKSLSKALGLEEDASWNRYNAVFAAVMKRDDMKERFTEIMLELIDGAMSSENICATVDELSGMQEETLVYLQSLADSEGETEEESQQIYSEYVELLEEERQKIKDFANSRPSYILEELEVLESY